MILSGRQITDAHARGDIVIDPFECANVNPNSYNFRLGSQLIERHINVNGYEEEKTFSLAVDGYTLIPGRLYLGCTNERIGSNKYVTTLLGRSSLGRLGLFLNATADLGHVGSDSCWTLELSVVQPLKIYPGMRVGQVAFWKIFGQTEAYKGRYLFDTIPAPNRDLTLIRNTERAQR